MISRFLEKKLCTPHQREVSLHLPPKASRHFKLIMVLFFPGQPRTPLSIQCRLVYILSYTLGLVLLCAYSAAVISFLTVHTTNLPIKTFEQLYQDKTYSVRAVRGSSTLEALRVWSHFRTENWRSHDRAATIPRLKRKPHLKTFTICQLSLLACAFLDSAKIERVIRLLNYNKKGSYKASQRKKE